MGPQYGYLWIARFLKNRPLGFKKEKLISQATPSAERNHRRRSNSAASIVGGQSRDRTQRRLCLCRRQRAIVFGFAVSVSFVNFPENSVLVSDEKFFQKKILLWFQTKIFFQKNSALVSDEIFYFFLKILL